MTECRLGGCGPVAVMRTGPHLGGGPVFKGRPRPCRSSPRGRTSATATRPRGYLTTPGMPDGARFAGDRRASCVWRVCRSPAEYVAPAEEYATDHGSCHPETGDLPAATDPDELVRTLIAPIHMRFLITAEPIDEATADNAARVALAAALSSATAWGPVSGPRPDKSTEILQLAAVFRPPDRRQDPRVGKRKSGVRHQKMKQLEFQIGRATCR